MQMLYNKNKFFKALMSLQWSQARKHNIWYPLNGCNLNLYSEDDRKNGFDFWKFSIWTRWLCTAYPWSQGNVLNNWIKWIKFINVDSAIKFIRDCILLKSDIRISCIASLANIHNWGPPLARKTDIWQILCWSISYAI